LVYTYIALGVMQRTINFAGITLHTMGKETHTEAYIRVIKEWKKQHSICPECGSDKINKSYAATGATATFEKGEAHFEDNVNHADCSCGWRGKVNELKPKA